jgi:hypothetical protein
LLPFHLVDHLTKSLGELIAASQRKPSLLPIQIGLSIGSTASERSELFAFDCAALAIGDLLAEVVQHGAVPRAPSSSPTNTSAVLIHLDEDGTQMSEAT